MKGDRWPGLSQGNDLLNVENGDLSEKVTGINIKCTLPPTKDKIS